MNSGGLSKFNRIEMALRKVLLCLDKTEEELMVAINGKRTLAEKSDLASVQGRCKIIKAETRKVWSSVFDIANGKSPEF